MDFLFPLGVAVCVLYVLVVLLSLLSPIKKFTLSITIFCSLLTVVAFFFKPGIADTWKVLANRTLALLAIWLTFSLGLKRKIAEEKRTQAVAEREKVLEEIRILRGLLPICASCKKIRDDKGLWTQIESYIKAHSEASFSHGICPECAKKLYPELYDEKGELKEYK
jgi:hypothetical protein